MESLRRTRSSLLDGGTTAHHPYHLQSNTSLSSFEGHGGGKIRSRSSLKAFGRSGRRVGCSVPELNSSSKNKKTRRSSTTTSYIAKIQTSSRSGQEELRQLGEKRRTTKSPIHEEPQDVHKFTDQLLIRSRSGVGEEKVKSFASSSSSSSHRNESLHNDEWSEAVVGGDTTRAKTATAIGILKTSVSSKWPATSLLTSTLASSSTPQQPLSSTTIQRSKGMAKKSWQEALQCITHHRQQPVTTIRSQPIPIKSCRPSPREREEESMINDSSIHYNASTWQMYDRIENARRLRAYKHQTSSSFRSDSSPNTTTEAEAANYRHDVMSLQQQDGDFSSRPQDVAPEANVPEEVKAIVDEEEDDDDIFVLDIM